MKDNAFSLVARIHCPHCYQPWRSAKIGVQPGEAQVDADTWCEHVEFGCGAKWTRAIAGFWERGQRCPKDPFP